MRMTRQQDSFIAVPARHVATSKGKRVIVIGAGIGGLVCALELAARGLDVLVVERAAHVGGKLRRVEVAGAAMDAGPTVFTMRWVFDELFDAVGENLADHLSLDPLRVLARHAWSDDQRLDLFADIDRSAEAIGDFAGAPAARGYSEFCKRARDIYRTLDEPFLRGSRPTPMSLTARAGLRGLPGLMRISPMSTMWSELGRYFADPRLRQLFGRYATYCGSSPFDAPATLMLVAHVEQEGVWSVRGGMHRVAKALEALAVRRGARMRFGAHVEDILVTDGRASGVRLAGGEELRADAIVFNGDVAALGNGNLGKGAVGAVKRTPTAGRSLSAVTWNINASTSGFPLLRHTVFFSSDYAGEFNDIFKRNRLPGAPTVYVCAQDRSDDDAPHCGGRERMLLIVNAPALGDRGRIDPKELAQCERQTFDLMTRCGLKVELGKPDSVMTTPTDFESLFPATGGALYGQASHGWMASFSRPGARSKLPGLYLAGGSTHPGPGVPMAALSGRQAAASVIEDLAKTSSSLLSPTRSTRASPPADTPGGISTR
jgi:1-hydroxycarotenoid 3,4-desaturase